MKKLLLTLSLFCLVVGCVVPQPTKVVGGPEDYGPVPGKDVVQNWINNSFLDPDSTKGLETLPPDKAIKDYPDTGTKVYGYNLFLWINAKNTYGGYTGRQNYALFIRDGRVIESHCLSSGVRGF